jgi:hypothetical protein
MPAEDCGAMVVPAVRLRQGLHSPHYRLCQPHLSIHRQ